MKQHLQELMLVQLLATYLVILGHSYPFITIVPEWLVKSQVFLYSFHMPLFIWVSGYLLIYTQQASRLSVREFARKRFLKLLIPYLALSIIALLPKFLLQPYINDSMTLTPMGISRMFLVPRENVWGHFWFLPMIFIQGAVGFILEKIFANLGIRKLGWWITTLILFGVYLLTYKLPLTPWFSVKDLCQFSYIFCLGSLCAAYNILPQIGGRRPFIRFLILLVLAVAVFVFNINIASSVKSAFIALLMIGALISLCQSLTRKINIPPDSFYAQTYAIFLLSWPCQAAANIVIERLLHLTYNLILPIQFIAGVAGPILFLYCIAFIERKYNTHLLSFVLGNSNGSKWKTNK